MTPTRHENVPCEVGFVQRKDNTYALLDYGLPEPQAVFAYRTSLERHPFGLVARLPTMQPISETTKMYGNAIRAGIEGMPPAESWMPQYRRHAQNIRNHSVSTSTIQNVRRSISAVQGAHNPESYLIDRFDGESERKSYQHKAIVVM